MTTISDVVVRRLRERGAIVRAPAGRPARAPVRSGPRSSEDELLDTCRHEAAHALFAWRYPILPQPVRVSVVPRNGSLGRVDLDPDTPMPKHDPLFVGAFLAVGTLAQRGGGELGTGPRSDVDSLGGLLTGYGLRATFLDCPASLRGLRVSDVFRHAGDLAEGLQRRALELAARFVREQALGIEVLAALLYVEGELEGARLTRARDLVLRLGMGTREESERLVARWLRAA